MPNNSRARHDELHAAALDLVTAEVRAELDAMPSSDEDIERLRRLHDLAVQLERQTGCTRATARQHITKALRVRRGEVVRDRRGGERLFAGRPAGSKNKAE